MSSLSDVTLAIVDCEHKTAPTEAYGIPSIRTTNIKNGRLDLESANRVSEETYREWTARMEPQEGDLILAREAPVGEVGIVPASTRVCLGQRTVLMRSDPEKAVPRYLLYLLITPQIQHQLRARSEGSTTPHLNVGDIRTFDIPELPDLPEQQRIAHILGTLDDKIELNRRMNRTLEAIARAIFKSWFIDFDPVIDNAILNGNPIPHEFAERAEARREILARSNRGEGVAGYRHLFLDSFQDSPLGKIPKGWKASNLGEITRRVSERIGGLQAQILSAVASGNLVPSSEHFRKRVHSKDTTKYLAVRQYYYAYNPSRINIGSVGMLEAAVLGAVSPVYVVFRPEEGYHWFVGFFLHLPSTREWIRTLSSGSVRQSLSYRDFATIPCVIPPRTTADAFNTAWEEIRQHMATREHEIRTLAGLRDTLLPKLLSGETPTDLVAAEDE